MRELERFVPANIKDLPEVTRDWSQLGKAHIRDDQVGQLILNAPDKVKDFIRVFQGGIDSRLRRFNSQQAKSQERSHCEAVYFASKKLTDASRTSFEEDNELVRRVIYEGRGKAQFILATNVQEFSSTVTNSLRTMVLLSAAKDFMKADLSVGFATKLWWEIFGCFQEADMQVVAQHVMNTSLGRNVVLIGEAEQAHSDLGEEVTVLKMNIIKAIQ